MEHKLNWRKFTALERSLLAFSLGGADRDWFADYQALCDGVNRFVGAVNVVSCHIPTRSRPYALLEHFLSSTGMSIGLENFDSCHFNSSCGIAASAAVVFPWSS